MIRASGLRKADLFGQSDPYCVVTWNGDELGRTEHINDTCEPFWGGVEDMNAEFMLNIARPMSPSKAAKGLAMFQNAAGEGGSGATLGLRMMMKKAYIGAKMTTETTAAATKLEEEVERTLEARRAEVEREEMERRMLEQEDLRQQM